MKKTKKELLQDQICILRDKLSKIEEAEYNAENKPLIGKCFKYMNSFDGTNHWPLYHKVLSTDGELLDVFSFQVDSRGRLEVKNDISFKATIGEPCTLKEMRTAWHKAIKRFTEKGDSILGNKP